MASGTLSEREEIALAVGEVAIEAAWLEYYASELASNLIGTWRADAFVFGHGWTNTLRGLEDLLKDRIIEAAADGEGQRIDVPFYAATLQHVRDANKLMIDRNDVVHALWSLPNDVGVRDAITQKKYRRPNVRPWTLAELQQLRRKLNYRVLEIRRAAERIGAPEDDDDPTSL